MDSPTDPIVDRVRQKLRDRSERGLLKYGTGLDRDDLAPLDWLHHAQQEAMDFCLYLERLIRDAEAVVGEQPDGEDS